MDMYSTGIVFYEIAHIELPIIVSIRRVIFIEAWKMLISYKYPNSRQIKPIAWYRLDPLIMKMIAKRQKIGIWLGMM